MEAALDVPLNDDSPLGARADTSLGHACDDLSELSGLFSDLTLPSDEEVTTWGVAVRNPYRPADDVGPVTLRCAGAVQRLEIECMGTVELTPEGIVLSTHGTSSLTAWTEWGPDGEVVLTVASRKGAVTFVRERLMPGLVPPEGEWLM